MMFVVTLLMALIASAGAAEAASLLNSCTTYCHGMPPRDAVRKGNPHFGSQSSSFVGNHKNHLPTVPVANDCSVCHTPVTATNFGHQNDVIEMAVKLKSYSTSTGRAKYDKGVFFNQTSLPVMTNATCSNVSCHFEKKTPVWGSSAFVAPVDCNACHGAPPSGGAAGTAGSHTRHDAYFPGITNCQKCHPSHATFTHATSAGSALQVQGFLRDPLNNLEATGSYSGSGLNYLPSKSASQVFGTCSNLYCHSTGQSATGLGAGTAVTTSTWGSAALNCGSCHQNMGPAANTNATGKHIKHAQTAGIACSVCHGASYTSTTVPTGAGTTHVDKNINLSWTGIAATPATTYTKGNTFAAGSAAYGSCSNSYCHSTVQNATTGANTSITYRTVSWTTATTLTCAGCHVDMSTDATGTGSHRIHTVTDNFDCSACHSGYTKTTTTTATHVNGLIELGGAGFTYSQGTAHAPGNGYGTCSASACHGQGSVTWGATFTTGATFPYSASQCDKCHANTVTPSAPFYSTATASKVTSNTDAKVGAHTSHLTATDNLSTVLTCAACHGTVASVSAANHMNGTTNFSWSTLATNNGALTPSYNPANGQCANVYCHGASMPGGDTTGTNRTPTWNVPFLPATITAAGCGTCHGFPPSVASGHPSVTIPAGFPTTATIGTTCSCHTNINTAGNSYANIFVTPSLHINGIVDVAAGGACDTCHGYPPASAGFAGTQNNWSSARAENYLGGGGAHTIAGHVSKTAKPSGGFTNCSKCHNAADHVMSPIVFNPSSNIKVSVSSRYRYESAKQFKYSSNRLNGSSHVTGTCSNASCHFGASPKWDPAH